MTEKTTAISDACSSALKDLWHWIAAKLNRSLVSAFPVPNYKCRLRTFDARRNAIPLKRNRVDCCGIKGHMTCIKSGCRLRSPASLDLSFHCEGGSRSL